VTNAGGLDPQACGAAVRAELAKAGLAHLKVAVVSADDVLPMVRAGGPDFRNLETEQNSQPSRIVSSPPTPTSAQTASRSPCKPARTLS